MSCRKKLPRGHIVVKVAMQTSRRRDACCPTISRKISLSSTPDSGPTNNAVNTCSRARWPDGFRCDGCGHDHAYTLRTRLVYECVACRKQHSLLAGTILEQTKTALARWFLAIYLVTSSKGGIAAAELQRQLGFGSYQTAWSWLHKLRKAMVRPDREPLAGRVEADETYVGGPRPGKRGRGAGGKTLVAAAVAAGQAGGRRPGPLRPAVVPRASAARREVRLGAVVATRAAVA